MAFAAYSEPTRVLRKTKQVLTRVRQPWPDGNTLFSLFLFLLVVVVRSDDHMVHNEHVAVRTGSQFLGRRLVCAGILANSIPLGCC